MSRARRTSPSPDRQEFDSSSAKNQLRHTIDRELVRSLRDEHYPEQPLAYFGLAGEELLDVLAWREFMGRCTAVEEHEDNAERLELNVLKNRLEGTVQLLRGSIDDLMLTGGPEGRLSWPYQIINLDYVGGLVNARADGSSRRITALQGLFERQAGAAFVLFLTLNLRDDDRGELDELVQQQEEDLVGLDLTGVRECFDRHRALGHAGLLKLYVPILLESAARQHSLVFIPPVLYQGTKQMMHFAVQCVPFSEMGAGRVSSTRSRIELVNLPLLTLHGEGSLKEVDLGRIGGSAE